MEKETKISRRDFLKTGSAVAATACITSSSLPLIGAQKAFGANTKMKMGVFAPSHCALPVTHSDITGSFKEHGASNTNVIYPTSMSDIAKGLIKGDLQMGQLVSPLFLSLNLGVGPFKDKKTPLVTMQTVGTNGGVLVVNKGSSIKTPKDLVGKKIGIHSPILVHNLLFNLLLKRYKIDPAKDLTIKVINQSQLIKSLKKGEIDAFITPEPLGTISKAKGAGIDLLITKKIWFQHPCCMLVARRDFYEKNPEIVKSAFKSTIASGLMLNDVKTRMAEIEKIHKNSPGYSKLPLKALQQAFRPGRSDFDPFPFQSSGESILNIMQEMNMMPKSIDVKKEIANAYLSDESREIIKALGGNAPKQNSRKERIIGWKS